MAPTADPPASLPAASKNDRRVEVPVVIRRLLSIHDPSFFEGWTLGGSQCQPDVRKRFHTVLPFGAF
jgi:hypothetical protein